MCYTYHKESSTTKKKSAHRLSKLRAEILDINFDVWETTVLFMSFRASFQLMVSQFHWFSRFVSCAESRLITSPSDSKLVLISRDSRCLTCHNHIKRGGREKGLLRSSWFWGTFRLFIYLSAKIPGKLCPIVALKLLLGDASHLNHAPFSMPAQDDPRLRIPSLDGPWGTRGKKKNTKPRGDRWDWEIQLAIGCHLVQVMIMPHDTDCRGPSSSPNMSKSVQIYII